MFLFQVETQICTDPVFYPHYHYYVREMRIKAYIQLLRAYRSLSLNNIATTFGLSREFIEDEISRLVDLFHIFIHLIFDAV